MDLDKVLVDLGVIGQLKGSDKLGVFKTLGEQQLVIDSGSNWMQGMYRWYSGCNRSEVMVYLWSIVAQCEKFSTLFTEPATCKTISVRSGLKDSLENAITGLTNLKTTYSSDCNVVAQLTLICTRLRESNDRIIVFTSIKDV